ncbi:hypothetical protein NM208_g5067 [Fusarium decemcellulare]|uniref:Uncharacterized protein n=1 Tax=Fusarium decemcellulare TaxID=57161 RepID=A0ACC1SIR2_9HYPO|nr:hypothetical protein NM208_g5067 [Fusarium decemcellulare]
MVRSVSRSRGCKRCLRRKIKCDEKHPACSPCRRIKQPCPGVYTGIFMINASQSSKGAKTHPNNAVHEEPTVLDEPSEKPLFEHIIISTLVTSLSASSKSGQLNPQSWTQYLASWISDPTTPAWSIRATALAFCSKKMNQKPLCVEADRCYRRALQGQQACIQRYAQGFRERPYEIPSEREICTSLMLMYYEMFNPTTVGSWVTHLRGTVELLVLRGPQNCQQGPSHHMFRSLRLVMAHASIRTHLTSSFSAPDWCSVPFAQSSKSAMDTLLDTIYELSSLLKFSTSEQYEHSLPGRLQAIIESVTASERSYGEETIGSIQETAWHHFPFHLEETGVVSEGMWLDGGDFCSTNPSVAFHAAWIMIYHLMLTRGAEGHQDREIMRIESTARCSSLLEFTHALFQRDLFTKLNDGCCIQLVFPMEIISCAGNPGAFNIASRDYDHHLEHYWSDDHHLYWYLYDAPSCDTALLGHWKAASEQFDALSDGPSSVSDPDVSSDGFEGYDSPQYSLSPNPVSTPPLVNNSDTADPSLRPNQRRSPSSSQSSSRYSSTPSSIGQSATPPQLQSRYACDHCPTSFDDVDQLIDHIQSLHSEPNADPTRLYYCGVCDPDTRFKRRKDFRRHLTTTMRHSSESYRCRCGMLFRRKYIFRDHVKALSCRGDDPYICSCGQVVDYQPLAGRQMLNHIETCGTQRKRGRPPKSGRSTPRERTCILE